MMAREIHRCSPRSGGAFVAVNCGAIPAALLETELFGHARGAFTGASDEKPGLFEEADGGTLLLDEIASMEPSLQVKLLRILDTGEMRRVGETIPRHVSVRILAATNVDPDVAMENGLFRKDLYYRLNVMHIEVLSKRRKEDIIPLVEHFVDIFNEDRSQISHISRDARKALLNCPWKETWKASKRRQRV
jgi:two-component system response regulator GlrR